MSGVPDGAAAGPLRADELMADLGTRRIGRRIICLDETGSSNDDAFTLAAREGSAADGAAIFAERQTAGRGRLGRRWISPRGAGIHSSVALVQCGDALSRPHSGAARVDASPELLALAAGVAACEAIEAVTDVRPNLRWPNDLFVGSRKCGGVLVERRVLAVGGESIAVSVIGVGVNCLQQRAHFESDPLLALRATSLDIESRATIDRRAVARGLLLALDRWLAASNRDRVGGVEETVDATGAAAAAAALLDAWRRRSGDHGRRVSIRSAGVDYRGRFVDIDPAASIRFQVDGGPLLTLHAATTTVLERLD